MRRSTLLLTIGLVIGFALGVFVWQKKFVSRLRDENNLLREQAKAADTFKLANAKLESERVDPDELKHLRDGQTELLRLRGQVSQLRQRINEAQTASDRAATATRTTTDDSAQSPVETFTAKATGTVGRGQSLVTGGWKTDSGKRTFMIMLPTPVESDNTVLVRSQIVEVPEQLVSQLGLDGFKAENTPTTGNGILSAEDTARLLANLKTQEGVNILSAPQVLTASGMQAQIAVSESRELPGGQTYSTGPVVSLTPTVSANKQQVELVVDAQLNVPKGPR